MSQTERVDIKTGWNCNNRCLFCVQGDKRSLYGNKTTEEVKSSLKRPQPTQIASFYRRRGHHPQRPARIGTLR